MKSRLILKFVAISIIALVILIALGLVNSVISDRQSYRNEAIQSIESSYTGEQAIIGPVLVFPYKQTTTVLHNETNGNLRPVEQSEDLNAIYFPQTFDVRGSLAPGERHHGLYSVTVYELATHLKGSIDLAPPHTTGKVEWGEPYLAFSVKDARGIVGTPTVLVNDTPVAIQQNSRSFLGWQPNLRIPLPNLKGPNSHLDFAIDLNINGTEQLSVAPVGASNHIELASTWPSPLFAGQFLPRTHNVGPAGFTASWDIPSLATSTQTQMQAAEAKPIDMLNVSLLNPIDPYKLSDRATKYGILFALLTFGAFFLFERLKELPIHPVQYLLVGFGLAIFFLLLISFSEHMAFGLSYLAASTACIGLIAFYLCYVLRSILRGIGFGSMLTVLYGALYGLLISQDNTLILGSLLLFGILATVMIVTRNVDWYKSETSPDTLPASPNLA